MAAIAFTKFVPAADWHELADQVFPADELLRAPVVNPAVFMTSQEPEPRGLRDGGRA